MQVDYSEAILKHRFDLLVVETQVVALIETELRSEDLLIENVAVAPDQQGKGYGRWLLAHAAQLATASGRKAIRLYTNAEFASNLRLYSSLGYQQEREEQINGGIAVHMVKSLI